MTNLILQRNIGSLFLGKKKSCNDVFSFQTVCSELVSSAFVIKKYERFLLNTKSEAKINVIEQCWPSIFCMMDLHQQVFCGTVLTVASSRPSLKEKANCSSCDSFLLQRENIFRQSTSFPYLLITRVTDWR